MGVLKVFACSGSTILMKAVRPTEIAEGRVGALEILELDTPFYVRKRFTADDIHINLLRNDCYGVENEGEKVNAKL